MPRPTKKHMNPYRIDIAENSQMGGYDVCLQVGALKSEKQAKEFADLLNEWMQINASPDAWSQKFQ